MTEAEWLGSDDPGRMLEFLRGVASERKLHLFACGCWWLRWRGSPEDSGMLRVGAAVETRVDAEPHRIGTGEGLGVALEIARFTASSRGGGRRVPPRVQASLLRCIGGNPFRPAPAPDPAWLSRDGGAVVKLAQAIYDSRCFGDLPILADTLEEAGCTDADILGHLRQQGAVHARGCFVLDCILGKE